MKRNSIEETVRELRRREDERRMEYDTRMTEYRQRHDAEKEWMAEYFHPYVLPANPNEYASWLRGYMEQGRVPTHTYNYRMPGDFYIARRDLRLIPLYGASSVHVIVPEGVTVTKVEGDIGHSTIYYMDGYRVDGGWVPLYENVITW